MLKAEIVHVQRSFAFPFSAFSVSLHSLLPAARRDAVALPRFAHSLSPALAPAPFSLSAFQLSFPCIPCVPWLKFQRFSISAFQLFSSCPPSRQRLSAFQRFNSSLHSLSHNSLNSFNSLIKFFNALQGCGEGERCSFISAFLFQLPASIQSGRYRHCTPS